MLLLIDNFDSFTHNLARYFEEIGSQVNVVRNNEISVEDIAQIKPDAIVISPGPCTPNEAGVSLAVIQAYLPHIPILGVCLGHQSIGQVLGARVTHAKEVRHGKVSPVLHNHHALFSDIPSPFNATRYHSLVLAPDSLPEPLEAIAWCEDDKGYREVMAIAHRSLPVYGVQFHPESLLTEYGHQLLRNFLKLSRLNADT